MRVRHHTDDEGLAGIRTEVAIHISRGWENIPIGVHVEVGPFGTTRPGPSGPKEEMGCTGEGAYVEFDAPADLVRYFCGPRNTAIIPTDQPFPIAELKPVYVKVRWSWWEFWRARPS